MMAFFASTARLRVWQIVVFVWILSVSLSCASKKLRMAQVVYRHGDISPIRVYPTYKHKGYWVDGLGQLTTKGMMQEYALGRFLKSLYINDTGLLNESYIHQQVVCRSADKDRNLMSAQTQLNGLYPPKGRQIWRPKLDWQPIPVHTLQPSEEHLFNPFHPCPRYTALDDASMKGPIWMKMEEECKDFLKWLANKTGKYYPLLEVWWVNSVMMTDQAHNLSLPEWANATVLAKIKEIVHFTFNWDFKGHEKQRLTGGPLVGDILSKMKQYKEDPSKVKQLYLNSAHSSTVLALHHALGLSDDIPPPHSSAFMVELWGSDDRSDLSVKMFYRVGQNNTRIFKKLPNCAVDCPLQDFISQTASVVPDDIKAECMMPTSPVHSSATAGPSKGSYGFKIGFIVALVMLI